MLIVLSDLLAAFPELQPVADQTIEDQSVTNIAAPEHCDDRSLVFISDEKQAVLLADNPPSVVVTSSTIAELLATQAIGCVVLVCSNPRLMMARVRRRYDDYLGGQCGWPGIHPSAVIHPTANLGDDCEIGPGAVIGARAQLGVKCRVDSHCVVEQGAIIGDRTHLHARVMIGYHCELGADVIVRAATTIGGEGFGLVENESGRYERIPHTGRVVIHDDVIIGSQCNIDRGTFGDTVIEQGCRLDSLVHIAHNVHLESEALILAQCVIAGSATIGSRAILSGQAGVLDHIHVSPGAVLLHRAGVVRNIDKPGRYAGNPAVPLTQYLRGTNQSSQIDKLKRRVRELEATVNESISAGTQADDNEH